MKEFFTTAIDEDVSNAAIKEYLVSLIKVESRERPLSDIKLLGIYRREVQCKNGSPYYCKI